MCCRVHGERQAYIANEYECLTDGNCGIGVSIAATHSLALWHPSALHRYRYSHRYWIRYSRPKSLIGDTGGHQSPPVPVLVRYSRKVPTGTGVERCCIPHNCSWAPQSSATNAVLCRSHADNNEELHITGDRMAALRYCILCDAQQAITQISKVPSSRSAQASHWCASASRVAFSTWTSWYLIRTWPPFRVRVRVSSTDL